MEFQINDIDLRSIVVDILKNSWMVVLTMLATYFLIAGYYRITYVPNYQATATVAVMTKGSTSGSYSSLKTTMNMAQVFSEVFQSDTLKEKIDADLNDENLDYQINAEVISETNLVTLTVTSPFPKRTDQIMDLALNNYASVSDYLFTNASLQIVQEPDVPTVISNPLNYDKIQKVGILLSMVTMIGLICLFSILRPTVKKEDAAKRQLDGRIIATIPYERKYRTLKDFKNKLKKSILISSPLLSMSFSEANRKLGALIERHMKRRKQQVLLVTSVGENEGKSSLGANIALSMKDRGKKVVIIDCDFRKPALHKVFELKQLSKHSLTDFLEDKCSFNDLFNYQDDLTIICQNDSKADSSRYFFKDQFARFIELCKQNYDYVIIDTPPLGLCVDVEIIIPFCDASIMVVRQDYSEIGIINDLADTLKQPNHDFIGFVLNAFYQQRSIQKTYSQYNSYYQYQKRINHR